MCTLLGISTLANANNKLSLCVFDLAGANGDTMTLIKDYVVIAKDWGVDIDVKVSNNLAETMRNFEQKNCDGIVADNFSTKKFNNFMGTIGAVGAIPNYAVAQKVFQALGSTRLESKFNTKNYEVVGFIPYGFAYFFTKDRSINSLEQIKGKSLGIMEVDPSQARMAQKVGLRPIPMNIDNIAYKFRRGEFDLVPAPLVGYQVFNGKEILGEKGGVANYPLAMLSMNVIFRKGIYPIDFGTRSRQWFAQKSTGMIRVVQSWEKHIPKHMFYEIPKIDHPSYDLLTSQLRKEFIENKTYDSAMINLIRHVRCTSDPKFIECKK